MGCRPVTSSKTVGATSRAEVIPWSPGTRPEPVKDAPAGVRRFAFEIDGVPPGASDRGVLLTLTAVGPDKAIEVEARLD